MPDAARPEKVMDIAGVAEALKGKVKNITLNLETGSFEMKDNKEKVTKTIDVKKGNDAAYVINYSKVPDDVEHSGEFLQGKRNESLKTAGAVETNFAETQDDLIRAIERWSSAAPGATKVALSIEVGRLQRELAIIERRLRITQYGSREVLPIRVLRRLYSPLSNDDRVTKYDVFKLVQTHSLSAARTVPLSE